MDGFYMNRKYLKPEQKELLERLGAQLSGNDLTVMTSILKDFALNKQ
jgi:pantothenate kinase